MIRDMFGDEITITKKRCEKCNEIKEIAFSNGGVSSRPCKCTGELFHKIMNENPNKKVFIGEVEERDFSYETGIDIYYDVYTKENKSYITEGLEEFEGKKVRVTVEVIE